VTDERDGYTIDGDEVPVVPWPLLLRHRVHRARHRVHGSDSYRWWVLWTVLGGLFSVNVTFTLFAIAQERIARDLGTDVNGLTWAITLPLLAFGVAAPAAGKLGDIFGHRRLALIGMTGAMVAAALSALSVEVGMLIVVRTVGQMFGAATASASMALIFKVFDRDDRVKAMGWWSLIGAGGPVLGVVIGGPVIESVGWRWMFWGQVPCLAAAGLAALVVLPGFNRRSLDGPTSRPARVPFDVAGTLTLAIGVTSLLLALNRGPVVGWTSPLVLAAVAASPIGLTAFWRVERRAVSPVLPLGWLRRRNFTLPIAAQMFANFAYMGGFILAPRLLDGVFGFGETKIGLVSIARPLTFSLVAPAAGYVAVRVGERITAVAGALFVAVSMLSFSALRPSSGLSMIVLALALSGAGMGAASPSLASLVANTVEEASMGVASAAQQLTTQIGLVAGIQIMSTVQTATEQSAGLVGSFTQAYRLGALVALVAGCCALFVRSTVRQDGRAEEALAPTR
jgi:MFS family permease